jgi:hypothetical protein
MSISLNSSLSTQQASYDKSQQLQQNYKNLFAALSSGNLQLAQTSLQKLNLSAATLKSNAMLSQISTALSNGDLGTAQNAINGKSSSGGGLMAAIAAEDAQQNSSLSDPLLQPTTTTQTTSSNTTTTSTNRSAATATQSASTALGLGNVLDLMA